MKYELTLFTMPFCSYCNGLKKRLDELNISYLDFDVIENREDWLKIVDKIGIDILPTSYIKVSGQNDGRFYIPGKDYQTEDEIVEIIKTYFNDNTKGDL